jgi:hypothetical protein
MIFGERESELCHKLYVGELTRESCEALLDLLEEYPADSRPMLFPEPRRQQTGCNIRFVLIYLLS